MYFPFIFDLIEKKNILIIHMKGDMRKSQKGILYVYQIKII